MPGLQDPHRGAPVPRTPDPDGLDSRRLDEALASGSLFPGPRGPVEVRETHASRVFLTGTDVYKLKKPVNLGFLDYSTLSRRRRMCRLEVELNSRLAPHVYLGVEKVTQGSDGRLRLNGNGSVVDYLVHMRRLADEQSLESLLRSGAANEGHARQAGERIGQFHRSAEPADPAFGPPTFLRNTRANLRSLQPLFGGNVRQTVFEELAAYFKDAWSSFHGGLEQRASAGRIRDGHGDLRAEHVYFEDGITIIDCVEFDRRYRCSDTALDFAFLAMDVAASGYPDFTSPLIESYESAAADSIGAVLPLYCWYRALVRAKVAGILAGQQVDRETQLASALAARRHLYYALRVARSDRRPVLLEVGGLPGTGKTTLSRALGTAVGAEVRSADETRKRLAGLGPDAHPASRLDSGLYTEQMNRRVYQALLNGAADALTRGRSIVLDATFRRRKDRESARALAALHGARFLMVECEAPEEVVVARLRDRATTPDPWSDATVATFRAHLARYEPPAELEEHAEHLRVATSGDVLDGVDRVLTFLWT
jgi:aminoglycoside phosphotransferase family enzyme/predicted kinase